MKKIKTVLMLLLAAASFSILLSGCAAGTGSDAGSGETAASSPDDSSVELEPFSPPVTFEAVAADGETVTSDIFADSRLTMVNVWATYCNPCLMEMPYLGELADEYSPEDFQIVGIISDVLEGDEDALQTALSLIDETGADTYTHLLLNESLYTAMLTDVTAVPTTFFVDSEGRILDTVLGSKDKDTWKEIIDAYLEE